MWLGGRVVGLGVTGVNGDEGGGRAGEEGVGVCSTGDGGRFCRRLELHGARLVGVELVFRSGGL